MNSFTDITNGRIGNRESSLPQPGASQSWTRASIWWVARRRRQVQPERARQRATRGHSYGLCGVLLGAPYPQTRHTTARLQLYPRAQPELDRQFQGRRL